MDYIYHIQAHLHPHGASGDVGGGKEPIRGSKAESENKKLAVKILFFFFFCLIGGICGGVALGLSRFFNLN